MYHSSDTTAGSQLVPAHWTTNYRKKRELAYEKAKRYPKQGMYDSDNAPESPTEADREPIREGEN